MNTSKLQAFATDARRQLMNAVQARLDAALVPNSDAQVDDPRAFDFLQREIGQAGGGVEGRRHVVERYAYRWFNRIIAFRYMDVHGFTGTPVVSPAGLTSTNGLPEVLAAAKRGEYDSRVFSAHVNDKAKERIEGLLSGSILADDPQGLAYGLLLQSECRFWNHNLPFMFENVGKEAGRVDELLMPADLLAEGSVLRNAVEVMTPEDCGVDDPSGNVEIIGWLYQYYNTEPKAAAFAKNGKITKEEIPAVTQLFTPDWIVRYMVENSLGRLWLEGHPDSDLRQNWKYYLDEAPQEPEVQAKLADIRKEYATLDEFLQRWNSAQKKTAIVEELEQKGIFFEELREEISKDLDPFDLICHIAFDMPPLTRKERANNVKKRGYFGKYNQVAKQVLEALLDKYADEGLANLESMEILKVPDVARFGTPVEILKCFGNKKKFMEAIAELKNELYVA